MTNAPQNDRQGNAWETFRVALWLGCTSFGGPIAHIGYFQRAYVEKRAWLSAEQYAGIVALCQMLPGPTSSQVGFLVGLMRAGWLGALTAWIGFTLPSAVLMYLFAILAPSTPDPHLTLVLHGLQLAAVAVVAQAVFMMWKSLCPSWKYTLVALAAGLLVLLVKSGGAQLLAIVFGAVAGICFLRDKKSVAILPHQGNAKFGWAMLALFLLLLLALPLLALHADHSPLGLADIFYRAGAAVFGGGHVVLPFLHSMLVPTHWVSDDQFLAGYGFAQAMPGPLFTLSVYLGAAAAPPHVTLLWAFVALVAIFLPGFLLALASLSLASTFLRLPQTQAVLGGINAAVVGILAAALYNPVWTTAVHGWLDALIAVGAFLLLYFARLAPILIVLLCVAVRCLL